MADMVIGLDDLAREICEHLAETDEAYRSRYAEKLGAEYIGDDDVLQGIDAVLSDPHTDANVIVDLANELLTNTYTFDGDSMVSVDMASFTNIAR